ncbi:MAG: molybdate ABC transporter substrate-binding protein [Burkholderiales bacterium]|nr:molybdate ABC transporter substrate-binding protein [Burkholderiales bacterium]
MPIRHFLAALLCLPTLAFAAEVRIFAAASLKESLDAVSRKFEQSSGHKVIAVYAASSALARQIENGAPADLFFSADIDWLDYLTQRNLTVQSSRRDLLGNELVLISPVSRNVSVALAPNAPLAAALGDSRLAIANPDVVPAGKYARAALTHLQLWKQVENKLARAENVRVALQFVARGESTLGVVYRTDALAEKQVRIVATFPPSSHPPIVYPVVKLKAASTPAADALLKFLAGSEAAAIWRQHGFSVLPQKPSP